MDIVYDYWFGEQLQTVIPTIAEFRKQVLVQQIEMEQQSLSEEINHLQHYFDSEAMVVVANDCGSIVGYASLISNISAHENCQMFSYYGDDVLLTEGPLVHESYREQGIGKGLFSELISICQDKDIEIMLCDPTSIRLEQDNSASDQLLKSFNFELIDVNKTTIYKRDINL